jgi:hypothetical protein
MFPKNLKRLSHGAAFSKRSMKMNLVIDSKSYGNSLRARTSSHKRPNCSASRGASASGTHVRGECRRQQEGLKAYPGKHICVAMHALGLEYQVFTSK